MLRVLYVDDDRVNSLLFVEACRVAGSKVGSMAGAAGGGVAVEAADSATEALELVQAWAPDLLVIDLHLPDGNGYELLPALRLRLAKPAPAFLCTADEAALVEQPAREAGFDGCWPKPPQLPDVLAALMRCRPATA